MKKISSIIVWVPVFFWLAGCTSLQQLSNLSRCKFKLNSLTQAKLAGVDVQQAENVRSLTLTQIGKLTSAYLNKDLPLTFQLNVEANNPNTGAAALSQFDWILTIDDIEMTRGTHHKPISIPGNGTTVIPMQISIDLFSVLKNESKDALLNFAFNLTDAGNKPTRVRLKLKPTINVGQVPLTYPDYISVGTEFGSN